MNSALMFYRATDEWATPQDTFDSLHREFDFQLDAAASHENTKCEQFMSQDMDALRLDWYEAAASVRWPAAVDAVDPPSVWLNPPYSKCREFVAKAAEEARKGCAVVCLVPSRTDTRWWHDYVWDREQHRPRPGVEVRFIKGRLKFGGATAGAPFPSVVIVFSPTKSHPR